MAITRIRIVTIALLALITPLGFFSKWYAGPLHAWVNNSFGGVLYEVFWCLVVFLILPGARPTVIAGTVFVVTSLLEILQLWHPPFLQSIRSTFIGLTLIGNTFVWWDFPHYILGCGIGWAAMRCIGHGSCKTKS